MGTEQGTGAFLDAYLDLSFAGALFELSLLQTETDALSSDRHVTIDVNNSLSNSSL
jgi:hypothetical protein